VTARTIDPEQTLGELVVERPALADAFERLRLDYCCGGGQTLAEACSHRGLDPDTVAVLLERLDGTPASPHVTPHDLRGATIPELCDHIVAAHHARLRGELPRIEEQLATVVRVHGKEHGQLHDLERLFTTLSHELLDHLESEEEYLFPAALVVAEGGEPSASLPELVEEHVADHARTGDALAALQELTDGYDTGGAYCGTHRSLLVALQDFELDLHQHVHEENNLLFPRLLAQTGR